MARTFKNQYGDEYPDDGPFARLMADYLPPPKDSYGRGRWEMLRDWAKTRKVSQRDMEDLLLAFDDGSANMVLGGRPESPGDLDKIMQRLDPRWKAAARVATRYLRAYRPAKRSKVAPNPNGPTTARWNKGALSKAVGEVDSVNLKDGTAFVRWQFADRNARDYVYDFYGKEIPPDRWNGWGVFHPFEDLIPLKDRVVKVSPAKAKKGVAQVERDVRDYVGDSSARDLWLAEVNVAEIRDGEPIPSKVKFVWYSDAGRTSTKLANNPSLGKEVIKALRGMTVDVPVYLYNYGGGFDVGMNEAEPGHPDFGQVIPYTARVKVVQPRFSNGYLYYRLKFL